MATMITAPADLEDDRLEAAVEAIRRAMIPLTHDERRDVLEGLQAWIEVEAAEARARRTN
jgi:hypothetical protein